MGCCTSQPTLVADSSVPETSPATAGTSFNGKAPRGGSAKKPEAPMTDSALDHATASDVAAAPDTTTPTADAPFAAPAPGVKHVRPAYAGKGWAPPQKEWESSEKRKGDKTRIEIEDEWDDDGNLQRTTIKHIITPDWKKKTEKTIEIIPAEEAEKMGLGRK